ncbi:MAG TPA: hypothetical protein DDZ80_02140 [Cyanobacteria bacterium UBA8803]|nr:hypothetical protein [Cyanobacteria bacterium UBA9273]HBL57386.1 hypothetical protein [Cyanobacteria bacterium UBA8803]
MKAIVSDGEVLSHLEPSAVEAYLKATGWHELNRIPDKVSVWTRDTFSEDKLKVYLPVDQEFDDYARRMYELMETLEKAENRSQLDIISELITTVPNVSIQGTVMQIYTPNVDQLSGKIIIFGVVIDKLRKIETELFNHDYILAIKAYQERLPIVCRGDLIKEDSCFVLKNAHSFALDKSWKN